MTTSDIVAVTCDPSDKARELAESLRAGLEAEAKEKEAKNAAAKRRLEERIAARAAKKKGASDPAAS